MSFLPRDPREASPANRTFWESIWLIEWAVILAMLNGGAGFVAMCKYDKGGADIAVLITAEMGILGLIGGWGLSVYQKKSIARSQSEARSADIRTASETPGADATLKAENIQPPGGSP